MNSFERVMHTINGQRPDRIPNLNIIMQVGADTLGVNYREFATSPKALVEANLLTAERYHLDGVTVMYGSTAEAVDLGATAIWPENDVPYFGAPLISGWEDLKKCKAVEPSKGYWMSKTVEAVELYKARCKGEIPIIGWVEGCFAEAADLMGVMEFLTALADEDEQDLIKDVLELALEQEILFAKAQVEAGADIIGVGDAVASLAGPHFYRDLAGPYQRRLLSAIKDMGAKTKLHICGNITPFLDQLPADLADIIDLDWMVPLAEAARIFDGKCVVCGNYDPVAILLQGSPDTVDQAVRACIRQAGPYPYISSAGCEVPRYTPEENFLQVAKTLADISI